MYENFQGRENLSKLFEGSFDAILHTLLGEIWKYNWKLSNFVHFLDTNLS